MTAILQRDDDLGMAEAFGRDSFLRHAVADLITRWNIASVVETGTWRGYTTRALSEMAPSVHAIEIDTEMLALARETVRGRPNVTLHTGDSARKLAEIIGSIQGPVLYYLDAHWLDEWPLFGELEAIIADGRPCVILIHDCQVPDHPELGFDSYRGQALSFDLCRPYLDRLKFHWRHSFNRRADGHQRGVLFVQP